MVAVAEIGNVRARHFWENRLSESQRPAVDATPSVWVAFLKQKYIQHLWIPSRSKTRTDDSKKQSDIMEDLLDIDFSGYGPDAVRMDEGWITEIPTTMPRRPAPTQFDVPDIPQGGSGFNQPPQTAFGPSGFNQAPTSATTPFIPSSTPSPLPNGYGNGGYGGSMINPIPAEGMSLFGNQPISMDYSAGPFSPSYPVYSCMPQPSMAPLSITQPSLLQPALNQPSVTQPALGQPSMAQPSMAQPSMAQPSMTQPSMAQPSMAQPSMTQPSMAQPSINQNSPPGQANFSVEYMFSQPSTQPDQHNENFLYMPAQYQPPRIPSYRPSPVPHSPHLTAAHPSQQPSMIGQHVADPNVTVMRQDSSKTTIVPLANPAREPPREQSRHQRGLSSVVRNVGLVEDEDEDYEDEEDYESRVEKNERKTDDTVKQKVMTALQSALSDLQLTGIQIRWAEIEVDQRIGVGGFAIVYHGMYR